MEFVKSDFFFNIYFIIIIKYYVNLKKFFLGNMNFDDEDDLINQNQFDKLNILNKFLSNIYCRDKEEKITFHQMIDRDKKYVNDCFKYPLFSDYFKFRNIERTKNKYKKVKKNFSEFLRKQLELFNNKKGEINSKNNSKEKVTSKDNSISKEIKSNIENSILKDDNILKRNTKTIKLLKNRSLPNIFITRRSTPFEETSISNILTGLNEQKKKEIKENINLEEENKKENEKINEDNIQNELCFINLSDDNEIKKLLNNKEANTERKNYMNIKRMKKNYFINDEKKPNNLMQFIKNDFGKLEGKSTFRKWNKDPNYRISKFNKLIYRCSLEINRGENIDKFIEENNEKLNEKYEKIQNIKSRIYNKDDINKIIDNNKINYKYKLLEEKNFQKIKQQINMKISDGYIFKSKKMYNELLKHIDTEAYQIFLKDLNEINKQKIENKKNEKLKMKKIEFILDDTIKQKELLKSKISEKKKYYISLKNKENIGSYFPLPGEFNPPLNPIKGIINEKLSPRKKERK